jgi:hypothetical protein
LLERDLEYALGALAHRAVEDRRPASRESSRIAGLELRCGDRIDNATPNVLLPLGAGPVPRFGRRSVVEREQRAAGILGMKMGAADCREIGLPHRSHADRSETLPVAVEIVTLNDQHVAAVASSTLQVSLGGRIGDDRRDDFEERVAYGHDGVLQPEFANRGIVERHLDAENGGQIADDLLEIPRDDYELADSHGEPPCGRSTSSSLPRYPKTKFAINCWPSRS